MENLEQYIKSKNTKTDIHNKFLQKLCEYWYNVDFYIENDVIKSDSSNYVGFYYPTILSKNILKNVLKKKKIKQNTNIIIIVDVVPKKRFDGNVEYIYSESAITILSNKNIINTIKNVDKNDIYDYCNQNNITIKSIPTINIQDPLIIWNNNNEGDFVEISQINENCSTPLSSQLFVVDNKLI